MQDCLGKTKSSINVYLNMDCIYNFFIFKSKNLKLVGINFGTIVFCKNLILLSNTSKKVFELNYNYSNFLEDFDADLNEKFEILHVCQ